MILENLVLVAGGVLSGLLAGLLYAFHVAFIPALRSLTGAQHIAAMQAINEKIKNPVFFLSFFGPTFLLPLAAYLHRSAPAFPLLVAAAALHIVGANGVTIAGNLPLNARLDEHHADQLAESEAEQIRRTFQGPGALWIRLHAVRTVAAIAATTLVFVVCLSQNR